MAQFKCFLSLFSFFFSLTGCEPPPPLQLEGAVLEIHTINVGQGDSTLVIGPNKTTLLIDAGERTKGTNVVIPYLKKIGVENGLDYMIASHRHADHIGGLDEVIEGGYLIRKNIWDNGSKKTDTQQVTDFLRVAKTTPAGAVSAITLGTVIDLGDGAKATVVAVSGKVLGGGGVTLSDDPTMIDETENDRSIALLIQYKRFDYITAGDIGGGAEDRACTGRSTDQENVESPLAQALVEGPSARLTASGVEVLHINHHGSESSTNADYMNLLSPSVAVINIGSDQDSRFHHPRVAVVDVLMGKGKIKNCITAPPALVLQTEEGYTASSETSKAGYVSGDIVIRTTGVDTYEVMGTGGVTPDERVKIGIQSFRSFLLDP